GDGVRDDRGSRARPRRARRPGGGFDRGSRRARPQLWRRPDLHCGSARVFTQHARLPFRLRRGRRSPMVPRGRATRTLGTSVGLLVFVSTVACVDIVGADIRNNYVEREEKTFTTSGKPDVVVATFDGSIEIRPWSRPEVHVVIEKRGVDKAAVGE